MTDKFGILYAASGSEYLLECTRSAQSAKRVMPGVPITLCTDRRYDVDRDCFSNVRILDNPTNSFQDKVKVLLESPYEKTLFLDTDTYLLDGVLELKRLLDRFDIACAHAPVRIPKWESPERAHEVPVCFPQMNTGVIAFRRNQQVIQLIREWQRIYAQQIQGEDPPKHDQSAFRKALYHSEARSTILPPEYNTRTIFPIFVGRGIQVKILHGRDPTLTAAIRRVNQLEGIRIFRFRRDPLVKHILKRAMELAGRD